MKNQRCRKLFLMTPSQESGHKGGIEKPHHWFSVFDLCFCVQQCVAKISSQLVKIFLMLIFPLPTGRDRDNLRHQEDRRPLSGLQIASLENVVIKHQELSSRGAWIAHDFCNHENCFCSPAMLRSFQWTISSASGLVYSWDGFEGRGRFIMLKQ